MQPGCTGEPGKAPAWYFEHELCRDDGAVPLGPELDVDDTARCRTRAPEHLFAGHHDLDRPTRLAGQSQRHRLDVDERLAAEPAADLGRGDTNAGDIDVEQFRAIGADHELTLAAGPDLHLPIGSGRDDTGVRLDIALMHRLGRIAPLDDDIGLAEAGCGIALG